MQTQVDETKCPLWLNLIFGTIFVVATLGIVLPWIFMICRAVVLIGSFQW